MTGKVSQSIINHIDGTTAKSKAQDGTGAYEYYKNHQAVSNAKLMLSNQTPDVGSI